MDKDWAKLAGDEGRPVKKSKLGRAMKLGGLATRVSGSFLRRQVRRIAKGGDEAPMTGVALDNVRQIVDVMGEMKGAAMKIGQMLSADPDIVNSDFADRLAILPERRRRLWITRASASKSSLPSIDPCNRSSATSIQTPSAQPVSASPPRSARRWSRSRR